MNYVAAVVLSVLAVEVFFRLPFARTGAGLFDTLHKVRATITSPRISDHWKEKVLLVYSGRLAKSSLMLGALLLVVAVVAIAFTLAVDYGLGTGGAFEAFLMSWIGIGFVTVVSILYAAARTRFPGAAAKPADAGTPSDYGSGARLLHRLALGTRAISETSFDIESATQKADTAALTGFEGPVFISGLARAGTTILMRALWDTGAFRSLTYRDMPFVLMPGLWSKLSGRSRLAAAEKERAHGDRVMVGFDSPEAFEEVFWRLFCGDDYIRGDRLVPHDCDEETLQAFRRFVAHALQSSENPAELRYLSKNNNDILRFGAIARAFPQAVILVPHRDPLQQAISLMRQHEHFLARHAEDRFSRQYMDWLGHHEFGSGHKRFDFGLDIPETKGSRDPGSINYWLAEWVEAYAYLLENDTPAARFVSYEALCADGPGMLKAVLEVCGVDAPVPDITLKAPPDREADDVDPDLLARAREIEERLKNTPPAIKAS